MSEEVSSAPVSAPEPSGFEVTAEHLAAEVDDSTLLQEAIAMANGKKAPATQEAAPKVEVPSEESAATPAPEAEAPTKAAPSAEEWEKYFAKQKELEATEAKFKERESRLSEFEKVREARDVETAIKLLGFDDPIAFLHEIADHGSKPTKERSEILQMKKEVQALREERDREAKARTETEQRVAREKAISSKKAEINGFIEKHPTLAKGLVTIPGSTDQIFNKIVSHYNETAKKNGKGEELSIEKAAALVEKEWEEGVEVLAKNPKAQEVFKRLLASASAGAPKARSSAPPSRTTPAIPQASEDLRSVRRGDKEMSEALAWMASRQTARRSS